MIKAKTLKILVCLILSSLILSSCGAKEEKVELKESVSTEKVMQQVEAKETVLTERVMQQAEVEEIVMKELPENNLVESSTESIDGVPPPIYKVLIFSPL